MDQLNVTPSIVGHLQSRHTRAQFHNQGFLPSVLIVLIADQILNDSLCCFNKYN